MFPANLTEPTALKNARAVAKNPTAYSASQREIAELILLQQNDERPRQTETREK